MLRRVLWTRDVASGDELIGEGEYGVAPFALLVEYVNPERRRGLLELFSPRSERYEVRLRVRPRNDEATALISRHPLRQIEVYVDKGAEVVAERRAALREEKETGLREHGL